MKTYIFNNQQDICRALYNLDCTDEDILSELGNLSDEISCIGKDIEQLDYVMEELVQYLIPSASKAFKAVIKELKGGA